MDVDNSQQLRVAHIARDCNLVAIWMIWMLLHNWQALANTCTVLLGPMTYVGKNSASQAEVTHDLCRQEQCKSS